jgi:hypothetical protein
MHSAVSLVQSYHRLNGYLAVTEYPVFETTVSIYSFLLSLRRGPVGERYGSWERFIR